MSDPPEHYHDADGCAKCQAWAEARIRELEGALRGRGPYPVHRMAAGREERVAVASMSVELQLEAAGRTIEEYASRLLHAQARIRDLEEALARVEDRVRTYRAGGYITELDRAIEEARAVLARSEARKESRTCPKDS